MLQVFDKTTFGSSAVMDWELVCARSPVIHKTLINVSATLGRVCAPPPRPCSWRGSWRAATGSAGSATSGAGSPASSSRSVGCSPLSPPSPVLQVVLLAVFGILSGLVHNYWAFITLRAVVRIIQVDGPRTCKRSITINFCRLGPPPPVCSWLPMCWPWRWWGRGTGCWRARSVSTTTLQVWHCTGQC